MALTTLYDVKKNGEYDYIVAAAPTSAELEPAYLNGETWLDSLTGFSYELTDQTVGTWTRTLKSADNKILIKLDSVEAAAFGYLKNFFSVGRQKEYTGQTYGYWNRTDYLFFLGVETVFADFVFDDVAKTLTPSTAFYGAPTDWQPGDIVRVIGSKRNDKFMTLTAVDESTATLTVSEDIKAEAGEGCFVFLTDIPQAVFDIIGEMVYFDQFERNANGLKSERVGTYSWTRDDVRIGGLGYPDEIVGNLDQFASVALGGEAENPLSGSGAGRGVI
jgi:hypothetical protein